MKRCTKCLLPETFPFIKFDEQGECSYCKAYRKISLRPMEELLKKADYIRSKDGTQDCIVMLSGGRDSSYLLHYVVKELKLHPLVFTYDWGMSTPIGEENAKIMCEKLGVEQLIIHGGTQRKRRNIRLNVLAWLKKPDLGMIPLFMAGDKHFFTQVNKVAAQRRIGTIFIGTNPYEKTDFKSGFCGVEPNFNGKQIHSLTTKGKLKMLTYYLRQFLKNPAYLNASLWDSFTAFFAFYQAKQEEIDLYRYVMWDEKTINDTLVNQYGWKMDPEASTTWRIGDGTAAFYNYIYYSLAGFTENDTLRSNQIREHILDRQTALKMVEQENKPRYQSIHWYLETIGIDYDSAMKAIDKIPPIWH